MTGLLTISDFGSRLRAGESEDSILGPREKRVAKLVAPMGAVEGVADEERAIEFVISTASVDRSDDTIAISGWKLKNYLKSPTVLWSHDSYTPAIARASNTRIENGALRSKANFAPRDIYPLAETIYQLVKHKFINTCSVGFVPIKYEFADDKGRPFGLDFKEQELLEWSICNIPCNPDCLAVGRSKGIDTDPLRVWAENILDSGDSAIISKGELEALRVGAATRAPVRYYLTGGKNLTGSQIAVVKGEFDDWISGDGKASLFLPDDLEVKVIGDGAVPEVIKAGRKISAKNIEALSKAADHIKSVMDSNEPDETDDPAVVDEPAPGVVETVVDGKSALRESARATLAAARAA